MNYSPAGLALTKKYEGLSLHAYRDPGNILTIGYGHTGPEVFDGLVWTQDRAEEALLEDLQKAVAFVNAAVKVTITQEQFDALVDFAFNLGCGALGESTLLKLLNLGEPHLAATQFGLWVHCDGKVEPGLVARRAEEEAMFSA